MQSTFTTKQSKTNPTNVTSIKTQHYQWFILTMQSMVQFKSCRHHHKVSKSEQVTISIACHSHQNKFIKKLKKVNLNSKSHTKLILWDKVLLTHGLMHYKMMLLEKIGGGHQSLILLKWPNKFFKILPLNLSKICIVKIDWNQLTCFVLNDRYDRFFIYYSSIFVKTFFLKAFYRISIIFSFT